MSQREEISTQGETTTLDDFVVPLKSIFTPGSFVRTVKRLDRAEMLPDENAKTDLYITSWIIEGLRGALYAGVLTYFVC